MLFCSLIFLVNREDVLDNWRAGQSNVAFVGCRPIDSASKANHPSCSRSSLLNPKIIIPTKSDPIFSTFARLIELMQVECPKNA